MNVAQSVREAKARNPQAYCPRCLWRVLSRDGVYTPCGNHGDLRLWSIAQPLPTYLALDSQRDREGTRL